MEYRATRSHLAQEWSRGRSKRRRTARYGGRSRRCSEQCRLGMVPMLRVEMRWSGEIMDSVFIARRRLQGRKGEIEGRIRRRRFWKERFDCGLGRKTISPDARGPPVSETRRRKGAATCKLGRRHLLGSAQGGMRRARSETAHADADRAESWSRPR
jgi:hypothetical protein